MILAGLALAALWAPCAFAGTDPAFLPVLHRIEKNAPLYAEIEATTIDLPSPNISLGLSAKSYQCWRLQLTSERGKRVTAVMERLKSVRTAVVELKAAQIHDVAAYIVLNAPDPLLQKRIADESGTLESLLASYKALLEGGQKDGLVRRAEKGMFRDHPTVVPAIKNDDYTMVYDGSIPECAKNKARQ